MEKVEVEILGISSNPTAGGTYALLLKESFGNRRLPIIIGHFEAQAIAMELEGIKAPRPMTHDLAKSLIDHLGAVVTGVVIDELRENTFYAKIMLEVSSLVSEVDSRPSDAIALAVRTGSPIYVAESVMKVASFIPSIEPESEEESLMDTKDFSDRKSAREAKTAALQEQLRKAIEKEDYERAAKIRDEIKKMNESKN